jgi:DNA-binding MarR family transcriptional regulator
MANGAPDSLDLMAEEIFSLTVMSWRQRLAQRHEAELSESQFLTLDTLMNASKAISVGQIQRSISVLPAQMSRIIRSLESGFEKPLIRCELNQTDKRKIDVVITAEGKKMYSEFRSSRLSKTIDILQHLPDRDRTEFVRICRQIRSLYQSQGTAAVASQA